MISSLKLTFKWWHLLTGYDPKATLVDNVKAILTAHPAFRSWNFGHRFDMTLMPEAIKVWTIETIGFFVVTFATKEMITLFKEHNTLVAVDGTHSTNESKYVPISLLVLSKLYVRMVLLSMHCLIFSDSHGEGIPVFQVLAESENQEVFSSMLKTFKDLAPDAWRAVHVITTDAPRTFIIAWHQVVNVDVQWRVCHWHLKRAWTKHIQNPQMLSEIKSLRFISIQELFDAKINEPGR